MVLVSWPVCAGVKLSVAGATLTPVTGMLTVTVADEVKLPDTVVAVMFALPDAIAVTNPLLLTVATAVLLDDHVTF